MERTRVGCGVSSQPVEGGVGDSLSRGETLGLIDDGQHAGKTRRRETGSAPAREITRILVAQATGATALLVWWGAAVGGRVPERGIAGAEEQGGFRGRRVQRNVGHQAISTRRDSGYTGLPGWLRGEDAGAATPGGEAAAGAIVVPGVFGDIRERGTDHIRARRGCKVGVIGCRHIAGRKLRAAQRHSVLAASREIDRQRLPLCRGQIGVLVAVRRPIVPGCGDYGFSLRGGLLQGAVQGVVVGLADVHLAIAIAGTDNRRQVLINGIHQGIERAVVRIISGVDKIDGGAGRHGAGVFQVEIGFCLVAGPIRVDGRSSCTRIQSLRGNFAGISQGGLVIGDVASINRALAHDRDGLSRTGVTGAISRRHVINGLEILGIDVVIAALT